MDENDNIDSNKSNRILASLAKGNTVLETARIHGVTVQSVYGRMKKPKFAAKLNRISNAVIGQAMRKMIQGANMSVETLLSLQADDQIPQVRLAAAKTVLEMITRWNATTNAIDSVVKETTKSFRVEVTETNEERSRTLAVILQEIARSQPGASDKTIGEILTEIDSIHPDQIAPQTAAIPLK